MTKFSICPSYCHKCKLDAKLKTGADIYNGRQDLSHKYFWQCDNCKDYVGCHPKTQTPLGTLAGKELRNARQWVHKVLDVLWRDKPKSRSENPRKKVYQYLSDKMQLSGEDTHVSMFDIDQCRTAYKILKPITYNEIIQYGDEKNDT